MHDEYHCEDTYVIYVVFTYKGDITVLIDGIFYVGTGNTVRHILEEMKKEYFCPRLLVYLSAEVRQGLWIPLRLTWVHIPLCKRLHLHCPYD